MANQFTRNFCTAVENKTGQSVSIFLTQCAKQDLTYMEVGNLFGYKQNTVRKWCRRHNIALFSETSLKVLNSPAKKTGIDQLLDDIKTKSIKCSNALYKAW